MYLIRRCLNILLFQNHHIFSIQMDQCVTSHLVLIIWHKILSLIIQIWWAQLLQIVCWWQKTQALKVAGFARTMLMKFLELTRHCVDLCFDAYKLSSIKDVKRGNKQRGTSHFVPCKSFQMTLMTFMIFMEVI